MIRPKPAQVAGKGCRPIRKRLLLLIVPLLLIYALLEPFWVQHKLIRIDDPDLPDGFDGLRIVFLSDIHHGPFFSRARVRRLVAAVNGLSPDLILLGGDYVYHSPKYIAPCFAELKNLRARIGVYGVLGNHDYLQSAVLTRESMVAAGIRPIDTAAFWLTGRGSRLRLARFADSFGNPPDACLVQEGVKPKDFVLLVTHSPDTVAQRGIRLVDLVLCGHTHGGQVTLFGLWAPVVPSLYGQKYRTGLIKEGGLTIAVSNGIGMTGLPLRFFARPQILIVELLRERRDP